MTQIILDEQGNLKAGLDPMKQSGANPSAYTPTEDEKRVRQMVIDSFRWSDIILRKPRREFNDMSVLSRMMIDQMAFNIYQPNNGQAYPGDPINSWKSHALRPIARNKVMSITAHATAKLLFPKLFAYNEQSEEQDDAATAMRDLIEWASEQNEYAKMTLYSVINACVNPASIMHTEYAEAYRTVKTEKDDNGKWKTEEILDESNSGFKLTPVPVDEFYIADFYTEDVQRQAYLIWRRVQSYQTMAAKYSHLDNFKYVKPGMQVIYNDANIAFYEVYDSNLRQSLCEEVIFYSKPLDLMLVMVNGVLLTDFDNPNPRKDKQYPFIVFGYENFDEGRSIYKKSLVFKMQPDADIINTLYPIIIDGTYLNMMPPMIITGEEEVGSDVIIPGVSTTLINPEASITPLRVAQDIGTGMQTLMKVEESINQSSEQPYPSGKITAFQMSKIEQEKAIQASCFVAMIASYVKQYGKLMIGDIIQYMTLPEVSSILDNGELTYKTFVVHDRQTESGKKNRTLKLKTGLPEEPSKEEELNMSYKILDKQGGHESRNELWEMNPILFRKMKYMCSIGADIMSPMSDDLEKAFGLEAFDKSIQAAQVGVPVDMEEVFKDFVLLNYPKSKNDPDKYIKDQSTEVPQIPGQPPIPSMNPNAGQQQPQMGQAPQAPGKSPLASMMSNPLANK
jgi:hypothetical protein